MGYMKILLCVGGRVYGEHAAGFAGRLSRGRDFDCTVLYVNPEARTFRGQKFPTLKTREEVDVFMGDIVKTLKASGIEKVRTVIREGEPTHEILQEAEEGWYHMVVTGTRGAKGLERHLFESVSSQVAEYAKIPVLVVRKEVVEHKKILVATDGSEASTEAVYCCGHQVKGLDFHITVLSITPDQEGIGDSEAAVKGAKEILEKEFGIKAEGKVIEGNPAKKILEESEGMDLVVMGSRGLSSIKTLLLGHVSQKLLADEDTNVLIVRNCEFYKGKVE